MSRVLIVPHQQRTDADRAAKLVRSKRDHIRVRQLNLSSALRAIA